MVMIGILFTAAVVAKIPEPDNIIYGTAPADAVTITLKIGGETIASYTMGANPEAGGQYIIRVPLDAVDPRTPGTARPGDAATIHINDTPTPAETLTIGERGTIQTVHLAKVDSDGDGLSDDDEMVVYHTDPAVADTDGDGIKDCEEIALWETHPHSAWNDDVDEDGLLNLLDSDADGDGFRDGLEQQHGFDPADATSQPMLSDLVAIGEVQVDHSWRRVEFDNPFLDPVVVAKPLSANGGQPAVVRLRNVDAMGFELRVQEWNYLDGTHVVESVGYLVLERGSFTLPDGTRVEADRFEANWTETVGWVDFKQTFPSVPVVLASVSSSRGADAVAGRLQHISPEGFAFRMQEQEGNEQRHTNEIIAYVAWEPSMGTIGGLYFEVNTTGQVVRQSFYPIWFTTSFEASPVFLADLQTTNGSDPANLRWRLKDHQAVEVKVTEEQSHDSETEHTTEVVGYMVLAIQD